MERKCSKRVVRSTFDNKSRAFVTVFRKYSLAKALSNFNENNKLGGLNGAKNRKATRGSENIKYG